MHSSRMRTVRCSVRLGGGGLPRGWVLEGVSAQWGVSPGGVCLGDVCPGVSA